MPQRHLGKRGTVTLVFCSYFLSFFPCVFCLFVFVGVFFVDSTACILNLSSIFQFFGCFHMYRVLALVMDGSFVAEFPFCIWHHSVVSNYSALTMLAFCVILRCIIFLLALYSCYSLIRLLKLISGLLHSL